MLHDCAQDRVGDVADRHEGVKREAGGRTKGKATPNPSEPELSTLRDAALLLRAAHLYYVEDRSQEEVAQRVGVSRSTVSRLLSEARRTGVVRVEVVAPPAGESLEREVAERLGIKRVYAAPGVADEEDPGPVVMPALSQALRDARLTCGDAMLVSWGRATWSASRCPLPAVPGAVVVPAMGGLEDDAPWFQLNEIVRKIARAMQGRAIMLHAPSMPSRELRRSLLSDPSIRSVVSHWDNAAAILTGIGAWPKTRPGEAPATLVVDEGAAHRAVGDVVSRLFDKDGKPVHFEAETQLLAVSREQAARVPVRIGVATGLRKTKAIIGAARSGLVNILVTDLVTASALSACLA